GQTAKNCSLLVEGLVNGNWQLIKELTPPNSVGEVFEFKQLPDGLRQVRFTYKKTSGNSALDDIKIRFYHPVPVIEGYDGLDVGDVTSYAVVNLPEDVKKFAYKVRAFDSDGSCSSWSEEQIVDMDAAAGIHDIIAGNKGAVKVEGRRIIWQGSRNASVTLADLCGRVVASTSSDDSGTADISAPGSGLYLLITPDGTTKLVVK
ncbi:MAG: T9SS type A sorting domain-containing protein, partial [Muribaculaceae bacterium]|nr:T9SS type A sorting domain-containing protein [Muribaculaceae bacterium]